MTEESMPRGPALTPQAEADRLARVAREGEALRANLRRRKQQARSREEAGAEDGGLLRNDR